MAFQSDVSDVHTALESGAPGFVLIDSRGPDSWQYNLALLKNFHIQHDLFRKIKVDYMFRYNFVPLEELADGRLVIAIADPSQLMMIDEIGLLLNRRIVTRVASLSQISDVLKKSEQSQRLLEEAGENFALDVITEDENTDETISIEKLTGESDQSPIIRLVDTTIFTALQRRCSDIHIETRDDSVVIKYRIDEFQTTLFAANSLDEVMQVVGGFFRTVTDKLVADLTTEFRSRQGLGPIIDA